MSKVSAFLDNMFAGIPDTKEAYDMKMDMLGGMEEKYESLISEGFNEDEALGRIVSEFGSVEEIRKELGFYGYMEGTYYDPQQQLKYQKKREKLELAKQKKRIDPDNLCEIIMITITAVFFISGVFFGIWHPTWVLFILGGLLCGIIELVT